MDLFIAVEFGTLIETGGRTMFDRLLCNERSKVVALLVVVSVGTALTAKNVISYPTECITEQQAQVEIIQSITKS